MLSSLLAFGMPAMAVTHAKERSAEYVRLSLVSPELQFEARSYWQGEVRDFDYVTSMKFCSRRGEFRCARADGFSWEFAVPRKGVALHDHWKLGHWMYEVSPGLKVAIPGGPISGSDFLQQSISILGRKVEFIVIDAHSDKLDHPGMARFLYSPQVGLLAYGACRKAEDCKEFAWLADAYGFCSDTFERSLPKERFYTDEEFRKAFSVD